MSAHTIDAIDAPTVYSLTRPLQHVRATDLATKRDTLRVFGAQPSAQAITVAAGALVAVRVGLGDAGRGEVIVPAVSFGLAGIVEWIVHRHVLHGRSAGPIARRLALGAGHRRHHQRPAELRWLMLSGGEAAAAVAALGAFSAAWSVPLAAALGTPVLATVATAWTCATLALLHYEWVHLLVHTRYRPRTPYYARLARRHRMHHHRDEHAWLGITSHLGDRLLRTAPPAALPDRLGNG